jgi:hypothetical protein
MHLEKYTDTALQERAYSIYMRANAWDAGPLQKHSHCARIEGREYVRLARHDQTIAIYRVRTVDGKQHLRRLKRYPPQLDFTKE